MNFQKTTQYALKVLSKMALNDDQQFTADQLSIDTGIPQRYLRRLMTELSKAGILVVVRGRSGGFSFAKNIHEISLYDIVRHFEMDAVREKCILGFSFCVLNAPCIMHEEWVAAQSQTFDVLKRTTLGNLKDAYHRVGNK